MEKAADANEKIIHQDYSVKIQEEPKLEPQHMALFKKIS